MPHFGTKSIVVASLNAGRMLQGRTVEYFNRLNKGETLIPDVLCVQDVPEDALPQMTWAKHVAFAAMTNHFVNGVRRVVGIAILSQWPLEDVQCVVTHGDGTLKDLQGVNEKNERYLGAKSDELIEATEDRVVICAKVIMDGVPFEIATTHGMWVRGGVTNDVQRESARKLISMLMLRRHYRDGLTLIGDLNFGRGGEIYKMFTEPAGHKPFVDCVPQCIDNTLDPDHPVVQKGIKVVSDYIMILEDFPDDFLPHQPPSVTKVWLTTGVSDHSMLWALVKRQYTI